MWINELESNHKNVKILASTQNPVYLIEDNNEFILIEGGLSRDASLFLNQLYKHVGDLNKITHWIILHAHYDHCGLIPYIAPLLKHVTLWASEKAIKNFKSLKSLKVIEQLNKEVLAIGSNEDNSFKFNSCTLEELTYQELIEGHRYQFTENYHFEIISTPGHSPCSISLWEPSKSLCFVSDCLGEIITEKHWFPLIFQDPVLYLKSIKKIESCNAKNLFLGHNGILTGSTATTCFNYIFNSITSLKIQTDQIKTQQSLDQFSKKLHQSYKKNSQDFVPKTLHLLSMKRLVKLLKNQS